MQTPSQSIAETRVASGAWIAVEHALFGAVIFIEAVD